MICRLEIYRRRCRVDCQASATKREPTAIENVKVVARSNLRVRYDRAGILARGSAAD